MQTQTRSNGLLLTIMLFLGVGLLTMPKPAHAALGPGYYDYGRGTGVYVMYSGDARNFADLLAQTNKTQDTLNQVAKILIKYAPAGFVWNFLRYICYNGINTWVRNRIYYSSYRSDRVYIYCFYGIPYYADPA